MTKKKKSLDNGTVCKGVARVFKYNAGIDAIVDGNRQNDNEIIIDESKHD